MKRNLEITLEEARELYREGGKFKMLALTAFKEYELKEFKYTYENCFKPGGYYPDTMGLINLDSDTSLHCCQTTCANDKQAKSMIAFAKLTHVVRKLNEDYEGATKSGVRWAVSFDVKERFFYACVSSYCVTSALTLNTEEAAKILIRDNEDLLKQYYMID